MRMPTWSAVPLRALVLTLALAPVAAAQDLQPVLMVAEIPVTPGKEAAFMEATARFGPGFDKLVASGDVLGWGVLSAVLHRPGQASFYAWYRAKDMAAVERIEAALDAIDSGAAKAPAGKPAQKGIWDSWLSTFDVAKHKDVLYREQIIGLGKPAPPGAKPWVLVTWAKALPGKGPALKAAWEKYRKPLYDRLVAEGTLTGYGFGVEELKSTGDFTHMTWISMADLGAREKVRAALDALPEAERDAASAAFLAAMDPDALRSNLFKSEMFAAAPPR